MNNDINISISKNSMNQLINKVKAQSVITIPPPPMSIKCQIAEQQRSEDP